MTTPQPRGPIRPASLPLVVRDLWRRRASGVLHLETGRGSKRIFFKRGDIVFAATSDERERLGERLVRAGKIKRSVLELAVRVMERSRLRFGRTLVEWGWMSEEDLRRWVAEQIKDIVYSVFTLESGTYRFEPADEPVDPELALKLRTAEVIYEGVRRIGDIEAVRRGVGDPATRLRLVDGKRLGIPVTHEDGYILSRVDGRASVAELVAASPLGEEETLRRLWGLALAGVVEPVDAPPAAPEPREGRGATTMSEAEKRFRDEIVARHAAMRFGSLYDRLGVSMGASAAALEAAYRKALAALEPAPAFRDRVDDLRPRIESVRRRLVEAYELLRDPERRRAYDRSITGVSIDHTLAAGAEGKEPSPFQTVAAGPADTVVAKDDEAERKAREARFLYVEAQRSRKTGQYFDAIAAAAEAVRLASRNPAYHLLLAKLLAENPACWETAREHFERVLRLDPTNEEACVALAELCEQDGDAAGAARALERLAALRAKDRIGGGRGGSRGAPVGDGSAPPA